MVRNPKFGQITKSQFGPDGPQKLFCENFSKMRKPYCEVVQELARDKIHSCEQID